MFMITVSRRGEGQRKGGGGLSAYTQSIYTHSSLALYY